MIRLTRGSQFYYLDRIVNGTIRADAPSKSILWGTIGILVLNKGTSGFMSNSLLMPKF